MKFINLALFNLLSTLICLSANAQQKTDKKLHELLYEQASPQLKHILDHKDEFQYQLIYTVINRDKNSKPHFKKYYLNVDANRYFNPASTVKLPTALLSLEKLNDLKIEGLDKFTAMLTDSAFSKQTKVLKDFTSKDSLPSIAHYIKKIFIVSDNDAYNRLYEWVGQKSLNESLWSKGYKDTRITRRFVTMSEEENRHTNPIHFVNDGKSVYEQKAAYSDLNFDFSKKILIGNAHYNREEKLINEPVDFSSHNDFPLEDQQEMLQSVMFPGSGKKKGFNLTPDDYSFLYKHMSMLPFECDFPKYDTTEFFNSYAKFFFYKAGKRKIPSHMKIYNKAGWSYGFLTDNAYIVDLKNNVEFMLTGVIYVNKDGVLNDNKYEYDETGLPFFKEVGEIIYKNELQRKRKHRPDLASIAE